MGISKILEQLAKIDGFRIGKTPLQVSANAEPTWLELPSDVRVAFELFQSIEWSGNIIGGDVESVSEHVNARKIMTIGGLDRQDLVIGVAYSCIAVMQAGQKEIVSVDLLMKETERISSLEGFLSDIANVEA